MAGEDVEQQELSFTVGRNAAQRSHSEDSLSILLPDSAATALLGLYPKEWKITVTRKPAQGC